MAAEEPEQVANIEVALVVNIRDKGLEEIKIIRG